MEEVSIYIHQVAKLLKSKLPGDVVTKEQLINCYEHELKLTQSQRAYITVKDLMTAAELAGKVIKGHSSLEINFKLDILKVVATRKPTANDDRINFKAMMERNKDIIIKAFKSGAKSSKLAIEYECSKHTIENYLLKWGALKRGKYGKTVGILLEANKDDIIKKYLSGITTYKISKDYGCSSSTVNNYLIKWGYMIRDTKGVSMCI